MEFTSVKEVIVDEEKSTQEVENELLEQYKEREEAETASVKAKEEEVKPSIELSEEDVLKYIGNRYGKEINSIDEFVAEREASEELPDDVAAYFNYKKETGRGMDDYIKLNKDYTKLDQDEVIREYYKRTEKGLDDDDISDLMETKFGYDEDLDEESVIKKQKLAKKREYIQANKFLTEEQEKYKAPLESSKAPISSEAEEELKSYRKRIEDSKVTQDKNQERVVRFVEQTEAIFTDEFKGFEFELNDKKVLFKPAEASEMKKSQENILNFVNKYVDKDNFIEDPVGYHRALSAAMNPEKFAKFFYEQGQADAIDDTSRRSKNINMDMRGASSAPRKDGLQVRAISQDSGRGLKIKSPRNKT